MTFSVLACSEDDTTSNETQPFQPVPINFTLIDEGDIVPSSDFPESQRVIDNASEWQSLVSTMDTYGPYSDNFTEVNIDFATYDVLALFGPERPFTGWVLEFTEITEYESFIIAETITYEGQLVVLPTSSKPFHIVKIPKTTKPVIFQ